MARNGDASEVTTLAPDDAFATLGNETRMEILQTLGEAANPLPFSELRDRVGMRDSGQFNYHLDKLVGHFLAATDDGYELRRAGERIMEAVVSGAVTETPVIEPTRVEWPCSQCGAPTIVSYRQEWLAFSCTECSGLFDITVEDESVPEAQLEHGYLGGLSLPPAAVQGRDVSEVIRIAFMWDFLERMARSHRLCPRCSAQIDRTIEVCEEHDADDEPCEACGHRDSVWFSDSCPNCHSTSEGILPAAVHGYTDPLDFVTSNGFNPIAPTIEQWEQMSDAIDVELLSIDPVEARITYSLEDQYLSLTVDEELNVVNATRRTTSESSC